MRRKPTYIFKIYNPLSNLHGLKACRQAENSKDSREYRFISHEAKSYELASKTKLIDHA